MKLPVLFQYCHYNAWLDLAYTTPVLLVSSGHQVLFGALLCERAGNNLVKPTKKNFLKKPIPRRGNLEMLFPTI